MAYVLVIAFGVTVLFTCLLKLVAHVLLLVDRPDGRKCHQGDVPTVGGLAMFLSLIVTSTIFDLRGLPHGFLACTFLLVLCGVCDDRFSLSAKTRLIIQATVTLVMSSLNGMVIDNLGMLFNNHTLALPPILAYPFTVFCVLGVINAVNMLDGVDGLAGGVVLTALLWFATISFFAIQPAHVTFLLLLTTITLGFLIFNMRHRWQKSAMIFMGDAGSMMLGFTLAWFSIDIVHQRAGPMTPPVPPITAVWIVGLPILDTVVVMSKRLLAGGSPFTPGRDHLHHLLLQKKISDASVTLLMIALSATLGLIGVLGWLLSIPDYFLSYGFVLIGTLFALIHYRLGIDRSQHEPVAAQEILSIVPEQQGSSFSRQKAQ